MGGYHQPVKLKNVFKGLGLGALMVVMLYAMLDESLRFSRAIVFMSIAATFLILPLSRVLLMKLSLFRLIRFTEVNSGIIGFPERIKEVQRLLSWSAERKKNPIYINPLRKGDREFEHVDYESSLYQLKDAIRILDIDEVIFCMRDVSSKDMIDAMQIGSTHNLGIYIHPKKGDFLLRSASNNRLGDFVLPETDVQMNRWTRQKKRIFEIALSALLILSFPFLFFVFRKPLKYFGNMWKALFGNINLVGMSGAPFKKDYLIDLRTGADEETERNRRRMSYIANYGTERDLELVFANFSSLDQEAQSQNK